MKASDYIYQILFFSSVLGCTVYQFVKTKKEVLLFFIAITFSHLFLGAIFDLSQPKRIALMNLFVALVMVYLRFFKNIAVYYTPIIGSFLINALALWFYC